MDTKLIKLKEMMKLLNEGLTREEFLDAFKKVLEIIIQIKQRNEQAVSAVEQTYSNLLGKVDSEKSATLTAIRNEAKSKLDQLLKTSQEKLWAIDVNMSNSKEQIIAEALSRIIFPAQKETEFAPEQLRDKLELLIGKNRLSVKFIDGLEELIRELEDKIVKSRRLGGGGFSAIAMQQHFIDWTVLATGDGSTTEFTLSYTPSPTDSLELKVGGGDMFSGITEDFTYNATTKKVTFLTAPPNGAKIRYKCRI